MENPQESTTEVIPEKPIKRGRPSGIRNKDTSDLKQLKTLETVKHLEFKFKELEQKYNTAKDEYLELLKQLNI